MKPRQPTRRTRAAMYGANSGRTKDFWKMRGNLSAIMPVQILLNCEKDFFFLVREGVNCYAR